MGFREDVQLREIVFENVVKHQNDIFFLCVHQVIRVRQSCERRQKLIGQTRGIVATRVNCEVIFVSRTAQMFLNFFGFFEVPGAVNSIGSSL